jgi:type VI secretion system secreted protein Hcp
MAVDYFLKIAGIEGESADAKHANEIQLESWSFSEQNSGHHLQGGGGGAGKVSMSDFNFVMKANKSSTKLFLACATGQHIDNAILTCRKAGGDQQEFLKWTFTDLLVSSYQTGGSGGSDSIPIESISFNFSKIEVAYCPQKKDGTLDAAQKAGYDLKKSVKV